jgi:hypothetical protein
MPKPIIAACDKSIYTDNLVHLDDRVPHAEALEHLGSGRRLRKIKMMGI